MFLLSITEVRQDHKAIFERMLLETINIGNNKDSNDISSNSSLLPLFLFLLYQENISLFASIYHFELYLVLFWCIEL